MARNGAAVDHRAAVTWSLLRWGVLAGPFYLAVSLIQAGRTRVLRWHGVASGSPWHLVRCARGVGMARRHVAPSEPTAPDVIRNA